MLGSNWGSLLTWMVTFIPLVGIPKHVMGIAKHVVTTISAFSFRMLLLDRILTHIINHISNTLYHLQYLSCQGWMSSVVLVKKPNVITCIAKIFLSAFFRMSIQISTLLKIYLSENQTIVKEIRYRKLRAMVMSAIGKSHTIAKTISVTRLVLKGYAIISEHNLTRELKQSLSILKR
jgi:hypothetical protein